MHCPFSFAKKSLFCLHPLQRLLSPAENDGTLLDATWSVRLYTLLYVVKRYCAKFETGQTFDPTTPNISFVPWFPKRSATMLDPFAQLFQHCWWGPSTLITLSLQSLMGCIFPTMHCGSQHCWELLHPFVHHCQHRRNNFQQCWELLCRFARSFTFRAHLNNQLNLFSGAFDALLKWPFDYRVTFYLLDQDDDHTHRKHIKFTIKPNPCPENEPFLGRPKLEKNASFGGAKFAKHEEIETRNYLKDDTIFLKIAIDCDGLSEPWKTKQV